MKKIFWVSALCIAFISVMPVIAQEENSKIGSPYYYVNVPIERVYPYKKGYIIDYQTGTTGTRTARTYIPLEWFETGPRAETGEPPKGDVILMGAGTAWPYLTVYYKEGEFSHVRLYLRKERNHRSWGSLQRGVNLDEHFEDVTTIELAF
jgi:hypothetical protein